MAENRTDTVEVSLTPSEKAEIQEAAKRAGMKTGPFLRYAALREARS